MAESGHDDLADALARMAGGEIAPSENLPHGEMDPNPAPAPVPVKPPVRKVAPAARPATTAPGAKTAAATRPAVTVTPGSRPAPTARPVTAAPGAKPPAPMTARPTATVRQASPPATATPAPPVARATRPAAPTTVAPTTAASSTARPQRPNAPTARPAAPPPQAVPVPVEQPAVVEDDDDAVIVPAYESSQLARPSAAVANARVATAKKKRLDFRRTCIPVLLTSGVLMFVFGGCKFLIGDESSLSTLPNTIPFVMFAAGAVLLGLAGVNMVSVQKEMAADAAATR